jgi:serine/threonine protein kinase
MSGLEDAPIQWLCTLFADGHDVDDFDSKGFYGTPDYASVRALRGHFRTPRDDLESLACCLVEMALGKLPWKLTNSSECAAGWSDERLDEMADQKERHWEECIREVSLMTLFCGKTRSHTFM